MKREGEREEGRGGQGREGREEEWEEKEACHSKIGYYRREMWVVPR